VNVISQAQLRVSGPGITPFGPAQQQELINVFADGSRNLSRSQFRIVMVADVYTNRRLLQVCCSARLVRPWYQNTDDVLCPCSTAWRMQNMLMVHTSMR
jgi:hypothetical protein